MKGIPPQRFMETPPRGSFIHPGLHLETPSAAIAAVIFHDLSRRWHITVSFSGPGMALCYLIQTHFTCGRIDERKLINGQ